jgi:hypothetical protein
MPFQSKAQIRACFANQKRNPNSNWDCKEWLHETGTTKNLPERKSNVKSPKRKIITGPKGGKYYINSQNKKVYIKLTD